MPEKIGKHTFKLNNQPSVISWAAAVGKKEGEGPLGREFDKIYKNALLGEKSFEKAETALQKSAAALALEKAELTPDKVDTAFAGDLLNQCIGSSFSQRDLNMPFAGLYGACSTMALALALAAFFADTGAVRYSLAATSSHFCSAERQYRYPLEYGGQRSPAAQWTVTGAGAALVGAHTENKPFIEAVHFGRVCDYGVTDQNNMGAAMAPAAAQTVFEFLSDTETNPADYDMILTGDLGKTGSRLLCELMKREYGLDINLFHRDCGLMIFDLKKQDVHSGGSGCGCSASVVCSHILGGLQRKKYKKVMFAATGALLSPTSTLQGESIPSIAHGVILSAGESE